VEIEGCGYQVTIQKIHDWLEELSEASSDITEDKLECDFDGDSHRKELNQGHTIGSGPYSVKMKLVHNIPQFMCGKRIRLNHGGMLKHCTNCFEAHQRKGCSSAKVTYAKYVNNFMQDYPFILESHYGKWSQIMKSWPDSKGLTVGWKVIFRSGNQVALCQNSDSTTTTPHHVPAILALKNNQLENAPWRNTNKKVPNINILPDSDLITRLLNKGLEISSTVISKQGTPSQPNGQPATTGLSSKKLALGHREGLSTNQKTHWRVNESAHGICALIYFTNRTK
jgi:hypothetical protein